MSNQIQTSFNFHILVNVVCFIYLYSEHLSYNSYFEGSF